MAIKLAEENPKVASVILLAFAGYIYKTYGNSSGWTSPWLDNRTISSEMNTKQLLKTDFKPELAENTKWDVIIIGSGIWIIITFSDCILHVFTLYVIHL